MSTDPKVLVNENALTSVAAMLQHGKRERTEAEKRFDKIVESCVFKEPHVQMPAAPEILKHEGKRLYTVTTIASSARFGGKRTVTVCSDFEHAKRIIENNEGDIFECSYMLAVIDTIVDGWLYAVIDEQYWYCWVGDSETGSYKPIQRPEAFEGTCGIGGIG